MDKLLKACDQNIPSIVLLLDLSAAFDTVDHTKLLNILHCEIGITGTALNWYKSFLTGRTLKVKIGESYSDMIELLYGVAQGSVSGPRLFNIYVRSLYQYVTPTKYEIDGFADDHQLMKQFIPKLQHSLSEDINFCLNRLSDWMRDHFLCLNESKTKILVISPPSISKQIIISGIFMNSNCIRFSESAKNLGFILDSQLTFDQQVNKVVKSCFMVLKNLAKIKYFLSPEHLKTLICSYIFSKIDYCNVMYYRLSSINIKKLQHVQNCAARLVTGQNIRSSVDNLFTQFHWLKVRERILYKMLLTVHKCLHQQAPNSLCKLLQYAELQRLMNLRETKTRGRFGERCFSHAGPKLWNALPFNIRNEHDTESFKKLLKSYLMLHAEEYNIKINRT